MKNERRRGERHGKKVDVANNQMVKTLPMATAQTPAEARHPLTHPPRCRLRRRLWSASPES